MREQASGGIDVAGGNSVDNEAVTADDASAAGCGGAAANTATARALHLYTCRRCGQISVNSKRSGEAEGSNPVGF